MISDKVIRNIWCLLPEAGSWNRQVQEGRVLLSGIHVGFSTVHLNALIFSQVSGKHHQEHKHCFSGKNADPETPPEREKEQKRDGN